MANEIQKRLIAIQQRIHAPKSEFNKFGGFSYRNAEAIYQALKPLLKEFECVLTLSDSVELIGDRFYIKATATLLYNGESISVSSYARESFDKRGMDSAQVTGSCSSYARKYALGGLFLIDDNKDFDSMDNSHTQANTQPTQATQEKQEVSLALEVVSALKREGLSNADIQRYMAHVGLKSSDSKGLRKWLDNVDANVKEAVAFIFAEV